MVVDGVDEGLTDEDAAALLLDAVEELGAATGFVEVELVLFVAGALA